MAGRSAVIISAGMSLTFVPLSYDFKDTVSFLCPCLVLQFLSLLAEMSRKEIFLHLSFLLNRKIQPYTLLFSVLCLTELRLTALLTPRKKRQHHSNKIKFIKTILVSVCAVAHGSSTRWVELSVVLISYLIL